MSAVVVMVEAGAIEVVEVVGAVVVMVVVGTVVVVVVVIGAPPPPRPVVTMVPVTIVVDAGEPVATAEETEEARVVPLQLKVETGGPGGGAGEDPGEAPVSMPGQRVIRRLHSEDCPNSSVDMSTWSMVT